MLKIDAERLRESFHIVDGDVPLTAFNRADVGPMEPGQFPQSLLREASLISQGAEIRGERAASGLRVLWRLHNSVRIAC